MLRTSIFCSFLGVAAGYQMGAARFASRSLRGGATAAVSMSAAAPPADAVSMKSAGLCSKLTVPSELLDKTDVFIFDCDGVIWKGDSLIDGVPATLKGRRVLVSLTEGGGLVVSAAFPNFNPPVTHDDPNSTSCSSGA